MLPLKKLTEQLVTAVIKQVLLGLQDCHQKGLPHGGVNLSNVHLKKLNGAVAAKLMNLGTSAVLQGVGGTSKKLIGAPVFNAPEVKTLPRDIRSDIWSLGIVCYMFLSGSYPYDVSDITTMRELEYQVANKNFKKELVKDEELAYTSNECKDFLVRCLERDLAKRPTAEELLNHPWLDMKTTIEPPESKMKDLFLKLIMVDKGDLDFYSAFASPEFLQSNMCELFSKLAEGSSTISPRDFYKALQRQNLNIFLQESDRLYAELNTPGDNQLTCEQFAEGGIRVAVLTHLKKLDRLFKECNVDCHGRVSSQSIRRCMAKWGFSASEVALFVRETGIDEYDDTLYANIRKYAKKVFKLTFK